jgi:hypothetical protein
MTDGPRTLRDMAERERRRGLLSSPHMRTLRDYAASIRGPSVEVPDFDPLDGGINAEVLFLFEKPGPLAAGSGFISRNNDDPTAEATFKFMEEAKIPREKTILWNVIPWWDGTIKLNADQRGRGIAQLSALALKLPRVSAVVLVGNQAAMARPLFKDMERFQLFASAHPSPKVKATNPTLWKSIPKKWAQVRPFLT